VRRSPTALLLSISFTAAVAGCGSSSTSLTTTTPSTTRCAISATASSRSFPPSGGSGSLAITSARECTWTVGSEAAWIVPERADGQGEATLPFTVIANVSPTARRGMLTIDATRIEVAQDGAPCRYELDTTHITVATGGGAAFDWFEYEPLDS